MEELKKIIGNNISALRKQAELTQTELGSMLSFSDKAVSKWERGESVPDVETLVKISSIFGVDLNYLVTEVDSKSVGQSQNEDNNTVRRAIIMLLSASIVLLFSTIIFVTLGIFAVDDFKKLSLIYVYSIPIVAIVLLFFSIKWWGKGLATSIIASVILWSLLIAIFLSFKINYMWLIFLIGIFGQLVIIFWSVLKQKVKTISEEISEKK